MAKFRKKPVVIEAEQWFAGKKIDGLEYGFMMPDFAGLHPGGHFASIKTLEGVMAVSPGDWVITGIKGEKYPIKDEIFQATYEPADAAEEIR